MIRDIIWDSLRNDFVLNGLGVAADGSNIWQADTVDTLHVKPALVVRWGTATPAVGERTATRWTGAGTQTLQVWVHDDGGDFARIDAIIDRIRTVLSGLVGVPGASGERLIQADWAGDSGDLRDDGYGTITRHSDWIIAQGWR